MAMTVDEAFANIIRQAAGSGAAYFAENQHEFRGSQKSLVEHFEPVVESFLAYRGDLVRDFKEAIANEVLS